MSDLVFKWAWRHFVLNVTEYGVHHGNCPYDSWNKGLTHCKCGLFALIRDANRALKAKENQGA